MKRFYSGDIVFYYKKGRNGQIVDIDDEGNCMVIMNNQDFIYENAISINEDDLSLITREYKIMNLTESPDYVTRELKLLAKLSPIEKQFSFLADESFTENTMFDPNITQLFVLPLNCDLSREFQRNPESKKTISTADFELVRANIDGRPENIRKLRTANPRLRGKL